MRIIALEYHDVVREDSWHESGFPGSAAATYKLSVSDFEEHLQVLHKAGCAVITGIPDGDAAKNELPVVLTFDDGGSGYIAYAAELLERHGWRGYAFVTTGYIDRPGFLTASDLRSLHERGHVIGTHSRSHPARLSALKPSAILEEWRASVADLEDVLGSAIHAGSVPGGYHSRTVAELAAAAGLTTLFTSEPELRIERIAGCTVVGRYTLRRGHRGAYAGRLVGRRPLTRAGQWWIWNAKKFAKAVGGTAYLRVRERVLGP